MARLARLFVPDVPQLILQRGTNGTTIAPDREALDALGAMLAEAVRQYGVALHGYVLMPNHFHLLASASEPPALARALQSLGRRYVQYFNRRSRRHGTLWEGRYRSALVEPERYLILCLRYMELNPVRLGLVDDPAHYLWSSYRHHIGLAACPFITDHAGYWALGNTPFERQRVYRALADQALSEDELAAMRQVTLGGWALGDTDFLDRVAALTERRSQPLPRGRPRKNVPLPR